MNIKSILKTLLKIKGVFIEDIRVENEGQEVRLIVRVRQHKGESRRCSVCGKKVARYDFGQSARRWRALDFGVFKVFIEAETWRVNCPKHGVVAERVGWARHRTGFTRDFEDTVAWLAKNSAKKVVAELMRISWNTVGPIVKRVSDDMQASSGNPFDNLESIGIDETSYKKGHKYMTAIADHGTGKLIWAHPGYGKETLELFFKQLTEGQRANIKHITADGAKWIAETAQKWCSNAERSIDPFHVVEWASGTLDDVRKRLYREAAEALKSVKDTKIEKQTKCEKQTKGEKPVKDEKQTKERSNPLEHSKYALLKNPENLSAGQAAKVELLAKSNPQIYRAYLLKEKLRLVFQLPLSEATTELSGWMTWAQRCRIPEFRKLREKIKRHFDAILSTIKYGLSNSLLESLNNKIKLTIRMSYGFRNMDNMIALVMLRCANLNVTFPGRPALTHTS